MYMPFDQGFGQYNLIEQNSKLWKLYGCPMNRQVYKCMGQI
jgi:hypothetical protein